MGFAEINKSMSEIYNVKKLWKSIKNFLGKYLSAKAAVNWKKPEIYHTV